MNCEEVEREDIVVAYVSGRLPDETRDLFEEHYFGCDQCLQQVECARLAREVLVARPPAKSFPWKPLAAIAAILIAAIAVGTAVVPKHQTVVGTPSPANPPDSSPRYDMLARFDPPPYKPSVLRGAETAGRPFRDAMQRYSAKDFTGAVQALHSVVTANAGLTEARYYLGLSELLSGDRDSGAADLELVIAAGDTPYQSEARFYLAKALLAAKKVAGARRQLETLVSQQSEFAPRATEILNQLPKP
jgi:TolA-binding protein